MTAIEYLRAHALHADPLPGGRIYVWPTENITPEVRNWVKAHRDELLHELIATNDPEPPAPEGDIDLLLENLRFDFTGAPLHHIDDELAGAIRLAMMSMGKRARAELAARIDDELSIGDREGAQRAVQARWPGADVEVLSDAD